MTDLAFWTNSGVAFATGLAVSSPRIIYDTYSQRWFACMEDFKLTGPQTGNRFLLAVSDSADPTGTWHGFGFSADPVNGYYADFPTLGVDADGVHLSGRHVQRQLRQHRC